MTETKKLNLWVPGMGTIWEHHKNGIEYEVYDVTNEDADEERTDYRTTVSYIGPNGKKWSKSLERFHETMLFTGKHAEYPTKVVVGRPGVNPGHFTVPKFEVVFDPKFEPDGPGLFYYVNYKEYNGKTTMLEEITQRIRVMLHGVPQEPIAGMRTGDNFNAMQEYTTFGHASQRERDEIDARGLCYIGQVGSPYGVVCWGHRTANDIAVHEAMLYHKLLKVLDKYKGEIVDELLVHKLYDDFYQVLLRAVQTRLIYARQAGDAAHMLQIVGPTGDDDARIIMFRIPFIMHPQPRLMEVRIGTNAITVSLDGHMAQALGALYPNDNLVGVVPQPKKSIGMEAE